MSDPLPMRLNDANARRLLREIAQDSSNVIFTAHARKRMKERKITSMQVLACLQGGVVTEPVALDIHQCRKLTLTHRVAGNNMEVAVEIDLPKRAIVITVI